MKPRTIHVRSHERKKPAKPAAFIAKTKQLMREINRVRVPAGRRVEG